MAEIILWLQTAPLWQAVLALLAENGVILIAAVVLGEWATRHYAAQRVSLPADAVDRVQLLVTISTVLFNTLVTVAGLLLWRGCVIRFRSDVGVWALVDVVVLLVVMDFAMYFLHRLAHHPWLFFWMHKLHHNYDRVRPLTLFILNPLENLAFGALWLIVIALYPASWLGMSVYLVLNVAFGTLGHLGVEPFPSQWSRTPLLRNVAGSTFHARHHQDAACNFGFYTLLWDRLFGTLRTDYWQTVGQLPAWVSSESQREPAAAEQV